MFDDKDLPQPHESDTVIKNPYSVRGLENQTYLNWINAQTERGKEINLNEFLVAQDIHSEFQRRFFRIAFGEEYYSFPLTSEQDTALKAYLDGQTPSDIASVARNIGMSIEKSMKTDPPDADDIKACYNKMDAADRIAVRFEQESIRRTSSKK